MEAYDIGHGRYCRICEQIVDKNDYLYYWAMCFPCSKTITSVQYVSPEEMKPELVHGDKEDTTSREARLDRLYQDFRQRLDRLTPLDRTQVDSAVDQLLCDAKQIYPDYPNTTT